MLVKGCYFKGNILMLDYSPYSKVLYFIPLITNVANRRLLQNIRNLSSKIKSATYPEYKYK